MGKETLSQGSSRRKHPRRNIADADIECYRTTLSTVPRPRKNIGEEIIDISPGGARLRIAEPVEPGGTMALEVKDRKSGETFRARGEVRWLETKKLGEGEKHFIGIQFSEVYTPMGSRERFTLGGATAATPAKPSAVRIEGDKRGVSRFEVDDYIVTCLRQGALSTLGLKRNMARQVLDISRQGVRLSVTEDLDPGTLVQFTLHLNKFSDTLETTAEVRWCRPDSRAGGSTYQAGLQFMNLPPDKRKMIDFMKGWFTSYQHKYRKEHK